MNLLQYYDLPANVFEDKIKLSVLKVGIKGKVVKQILQIHPEQQLAIAALMDIAEAELIKMDDSQSLSISKSEAVLDFIWLMVKAFDIFDCIEELNSWFMSPQIVLGNETPNALLTSFTGRKLIAQELTRLKTFSLYNR